MPKTESSSGEESETPPFQRKQGNKKLTASQKVAAVALPRSNNNLQGKDTGTPRSVKFAPTIAHNKSRSSARTSLNTVDIDERLLGLHNQQMEMDELAEQLLIHRKSKKYDLSDDEDAVMVELPADFGNFHAGLFMRVWLSITAYLDQRDKLLSLQFVSRKFRAIALAANHWTKISIKLPQYSIEENPKFEQLLKFLY